MSAIDVLREVEWAGTCPHTGVDQCMSCHSTKAEGHDKDCALAAALRGAGGDEPIDWRARYEALLDQLDAADRPQESARSVARRLVPDRADHPKSATLFEAIAAEIAKRDDAWLRHVASVTATEREACARIVEQWHLDPVSEPALRALPGGSPPSVVFEAIKRTVARIRARGTP